VGKANEQVEREKKTVVHKPNRDLSSPTTAAPLLSYNQLQTDRCVCACAKWHNSSVYETTTQEGGVEWKGGSALLLLSLSAPPTHRMRRDARCLVVTVYSKSSQLQQCKCIALRSLFPLPPSPSP